MSRLARGVLVAEKSQPVLCQSSAAGREQVKPGGRCWKLLFSDLLPEQHA